MMFQNPLNSPTKRIVFKFISLTCGQIVDLIFENYSDWNEYSEELRMNIKKCLIHISYDLLEYKLVEIFENTSFSHYKRAILAVSNVICIAKYFLKERKLVVAKKMIKDTPMDTDISEIKSYPEIDSLHKNKLDPVFKRKNDTQDDLNEIKRKRKLVSKETAYTFPEL
jgi:hypothetical protein